MENPIKRIMKTRYKFLFVGILIILFVFAVGATTILLLNNVIEENNIYYNDILVQDKYLDNDTGRYVIVNDHLETFEVLNDSSGTKIYNQIQVGEHYNIVAYESPDHSFIHIIRVDNATG